jgi:hypothetical protein
MERFRPRREAFAWMPVRESGLAPLKSGPVTVNNAWFIILFLEIFAPWWAVEWSIRFAANDQAGRLGEIRFASLRPIC